MKTLTAEQIAGIRKRIEFVGDDVCKVDAADLDKLLTVAESLIPSEKLEFQFWTAEPWHLKDFVGTHEIAPSSINPDADPIAILSIQDYARSTTCVNALAGVVNPSQFMQAVVELVNAIDDVQETNLNNFISHDVKDVEPKNTAMFAAWNRLRAVGGKAVS